MVLFKLTLLHLALLATVFEFVCSSFDSDEELLERLLTLEAYIDAEVRMRTDNNHHRIDTRSSDNRLQDLIQTDGTETADGTKRAVEADLCNDGCCRRPLKINITDALPGLRVVKPQVIDIGYCVADGLVPCVGRSGRIHSRLLRFFRPELTHCMPIEYIEAPIVYENLNSGKYSSVRLPDTMVVRCGCA